ncbi:helix-turn-helix transcriptional regulator [Luedemannella flava]|uniref:Helix-turn-helix transcriptional regulator n=1 Tax=Luedemannella flava TaxID=349316 RepID=A0ABP4XZD9_9ACTN
MRGRRLGIALRELREAAGLTLEQVAEEVDLTKSTISRIETAQTPVRPAIVRVLLTLYGASTKDMDLLVQLAKEAKVQSWWQGYADLLNKPMLEWIAFESEATAISTFEPVIMPGLLQTAEYARGIMRAHPTLRSDAEIERRVEARMARQERLIGESPLELLAIFDETALVRPIGDDPAQVLAGQREHLLKMSRLPNITIQVLPVAVGYHPAVTSGIHVMEFADPADPPVVGLGTVAGVMVLDNPEEVRNCVAVMGNLRSLALSPADSRANIAAIS